MQELKKTIMEEIKEIDDIKQLEIVLGLVILMRNQLKVKTIDAIIQSETVDKKCMETQTDAEKIIFKVPKLPRNNLNDFVQEEALDLRKKVLPKIMEETELLLSQNTVNNLLESYHLSTDDATQILTTESVDSLLDSLLESALDAEETFKEIKIIEDSFVEIIPADIKPSTSHANMPKLVTQKEAHAMTNPLKRGYKVIPEKKLVEKKKRMSLSLKKGFMNIPEHKFPTIRLSHQEMTTHSRTVRHMLSVKNDEDVIQNDSAINLYKEDFLRIIEYRWLNDNAINAYLELIQSRSCTLNNAVKVACINTHFFPKLISEGYMSVRKWITSKKLKDAVMTFIPVHQDDHWSLLIINNISHTVTYYCPLMRQTNSLQILKNLFVSMKIKIEDWQFCQTTTFPRQRDQQNCGVFICQAAEYLSRLAPLNFGEDDMPYFREKMAFELYANKLFS